MDLSVPGGKKASKEARFTYRYSMDKALAKSLPILAFNSSKVILSVKGCLKDIKVTKQSNWCQISERNVCTLVGRIFLSYQVVL